MQNMHPANDSNHSQRFTQSEVIEAALQSQGADAKPSTKSVVSKEEQTKAASPVNADDADGSAAEDSAPTNHDAHEPSGPEAVTSGVEPTRSSYAKTNKKDRKPKLLSVLSSSIPNELKTLPQWVGWQLVWEEGKRGKSGRWTKVPRQINGYLASVNKSTTWTSFEKVLAAYEASQQSGDDVQGGNHLDGVGVVLRPENGLVAVDLDGVRDPETGDLLPEAVDIVAALDTYTEISPSGTGLRLFLYGELPPSGRVANQPHSHKFEIYCADKYLTTTGQHLEGTPSTINERRAEILDFHTNYIANDAATPADVAAISVEVNEAAGTRSLTVEQIIEKAGAAGKGESFKKLFEGDISDYDNDPSAADLAFCSKVAFWARRDAALIDAVYRRSGLMRPKWNLRHSSDGRTYGQITIGKAIAGCRQVYQPAPSFPELTAEQIPEPSLKTEKGNSYSGRQIVKLLYPRWPVMGLDTNAAHVQRLYQQLGENLRYTKLGWLHFNGRFWEIDDRKWSRTIAAVSHTSKVVASEAAQLYYLSGVLAKAGRFSDTKAMSMAAGALSAHSRKAEETKFIEETLKMAAGHPKLSADIKLFDPKPWLLGFQNAVWDRGEWREHRREDYLLHLCPVDFDFEAANTGEWGRVLSRISGGDAELERTLQDFAGYALSGGSHLRLIAWLYGEKGTGKSTYAELLQTVLGELSKTISPDKLGLRGDRDRLGAVLWNKLLAVCAEAGNQQISPELLKTLSGSDTMTVRLLYAEAFDAQPHHVLFLVSNDPARLDAYDEALKDRIVTLPFLNALNAGGPLTLTGGKRIESVRRDLQSPLVREFTRWAVEGLARLYRTQEVFLAPVVREATKRLWEDTDPVTEFWESVSVQELTEGIAKTLLRRRYDSWCQIENLYPLGPQNWARACQDRGLVEERRGKERTRYWVLPKPKQTPPPPKPATSNPAVPKDSAPKPSGSESQTSKANASEAPSASDAVTPETVTPETVTPETVTPETVTPETVTPETVTPETVTPETVTPETVTPETVTPETVTPETVTPETVTPETVTPETVTPESEVTNLFGEPITDTLVANGCCARCGGVWMKADTSEADLDYVLNLGSPDAKPLPLEPAEVTEAKRRFCRFCRSEMAQESGEIEDGHSEDADFTE